ncbi:MAG: hypothetical protein ACFKPT_31655 [Gloeotrichia echinulata GP01]
MKLSIIIKSSVCVLGLVSAANLLAAPANAGQASARAAATVSRADGITETVSGEVVLPNGMYFKPATGTTALTVTPTITGAGDTTETIASLSFDAGAATAVGTGTTIESTIANILTKLSDGTLKTTQGDEIIQNITAVIKAAGGTNGFVGLE